MPVETEFRSVLRLLGSHPDDPKMQLRFALGLYAISDLSELLTTVVDGILAVTGMERAYVMLKEEDRFDFPVARNKQKTNLDLTEFSFSHTIVEQVLKQRKTHYSRDAVALHNMSDSAKRLHLKTILCIPLLIRGFEFEPHAVGVIYADSTKNLIHYSAEQLELFGILGGHAAMAIENARLYKLATVDPLTEVHLRHFVMNQLKIEWNAAERHQRPLSVAMVDIDHFKRINDQHGHNYGDAVLRQIAHVLKDSIRMEDSLGRYGGEEFLLILPDTASEGAEMLGNRLREAVRKTKFDLLKSPVTISLGTACFPLHESEDWEKLVQKADVALYKAKSLGRNRVYSFKPQPPN